MIRSFKNRLAEDLFHGRVSTATRHFPADVRNAAQRKLQYLNAAVRLEDLRVPPGNRLEALKGAMKGMHSIRINDQWRVVFRWSAEGVAELQVLDYH